MRELEGLRAMTRPNIAAVLWWQDLERRLIDRVLSERGLK